MATPNLTGSSSNARSSGFPSSLTFSHTSNGDPLLLMVGHVGFFITTQITGITFNGVALTKGARVIKAGAKVLEYWYLPSPGSATANVVITLDSLAWITASAHNVNGADFALASPMIETADGTSTAPSVTIASLATALVIDFVISDVASQTFTEGAGQTLVYSQLDATTNWKSASSTEPGAASVTMSWTLGTSDAWAIMALTLDDPTLAGTQRYSQISAAVVAGGVGSQRYSQISAEVVAGGVGSQRYSQISVTVVSKLIVRRRSYGFILD